MLEQLQKRDDLMSIIALEEDINQKNMEMRGQNYGIDYQFGSKFDHSRISL